MKIVIFCLCFLLFGCSPPEKRIPIAILTPLTHPSLEQIEKGFVETLEKMSPEKYCFVTYNAQGNKTLMRSEIEEIIRKNYPLVFTLGTLSSQMMKEALIKKDLKIPIVFTCVNDPLGFDIVPSESSPGGYITGVKELLNFREELTLLLKFKPTLKRLLLVFNPMEPGLEKDRQEIIRILNKYAISLITVEIFQTNEILTKSAPFMKEADAVLILKDNTVVSGLDALVKLCNRHHIPLLASDLDSPDRGAALGYGVHEIEFGIEAAKKALLILEEGIFPGDIPVTPISLFTFKINREAAQKQGLEEVYP